MREYHIGQTVVPYEVEWSPDRSTIGISMNNSMELRVRAPVSASIDDVEATLEKKNQWILETLYGIAEQEDPPLNKEFLSGEKLLYNGRRYRLKVTESAVVEPELHYDGNTFTLLISSTGITSVKRKRQAVVDWYINKANEQLPKRSKQYTKN